MQWWEATQSELDDSPHLSEDRRIAYYNALMSDDNGRAVLFDIDRMALLVEGVTPETAVGVLARINLVNTIKGLCGIPASKEAIDAVASLALNNLKENEDG